MSSIEQPKAKKQRTTSNTQLVITSTSTHSTEITTAPTPTPTPTKLDALPDEILLNITMYTGAHSCYLGYGAVNKRINQLFKTYSNELSKSTSYGGYASYQEILQKCETVLENEKEYKSWGIPKIFHKVASGAVTFNREDLLHRALEKQNKYIFQTICERAIKDGKLSFFRKVWNSIKDESLITYMEEQTSFIHIAAEKGYLDWLIYLREELGCEWDWWACSKAALGGQLDCLMYLHEHGCEWDWFTCSRAARKGHLDCLKYLHEQGCPWNKEACLEAAAGGYLDCLKYLHEQGCEWDEGACRRAAEKGHLNCLQYMRENGLEWDQYGEYLGNKAKGSDP